MSAKNIEKAIIKYLTQEADGDDLDMLSEWIQVPENQIFFESYVKIHYKITLSMSNPDINQIKKNLLQQIRKDQKKVHNIKIRRSIIKYTVAAVLVIALASTYFLKDQIFGIQIEQTTPIIVNNSIEPGTDKATLTLETGEVVALGKGESFQTQNAISNGEEITYNNNPSHELVYNYLTIPRGGQFQLTLSDGTRVWLNSETQLKYPVSFTDGESRQVELVYGEAYFDVSPSTEHHGAKFKVQIGLQEVEVLGTEFNIKAYQDEDVIYTTLVEGKVASEIAGNSHKKMILKPNEQLIVNKQTKDQIIKDVDVYSETAWRKGLFGFKDKTLKEIMKVLSRWYDVDVVFVDKNLEKLEFKGVLSKNQHIEDILKLIKKTDFIHNYDIEDHQIIIKN